MSKELHEAAMRAYLDAGREIGKLSGIDKQRQYVRDKNLMLMPCPSCNMRQSLYEACEQETSLDAFELTAGLHTYGCVKCMRPLIQSIPFVPFGEPWRWAIDFEREEAAKH